MGHSRVGTQRICGGVDLVEAAGQGGSDCVGVGSVLVVECCVRVSTSRPYTVWWALTHRCWISGLPCSLLVTMDSWRASNMGGVFGVRGLTRWMMVGRGSVLRSDFLKGGVGGVVPVEWKEGGVWRCQGVTWLLEAGGGGGRVGGGWGGGGGGGGFVTETWTGHVMMDHGEPADRAARGPAARARRPARSLFFRFDHLRGRVLTTPAMSRL